MTKTPNEKDLHRLVKDFDNDRVINKVESALTDLFLNIYPTNRDLKEVIIKVSTLDSLYSTQLSKYKAAIPVAEHIVEIDIDGRLKSGDISVVESIAQNVLPDGRSYRCYSFATKYCSFHNPEAFPIYDSYVDKVLQYFNKRDGFLQGKMNNKIYANYILSINAFNTYYKLESCSIKQLDKYLWQLGSELRSTSETL